MCLASTARDLLSQYQGKQTASTDNGKMVEIAVVRNFCKHRTSSFGATRLILVSGLGCKKFEKRKRLRMKSPETVRIPDTRLLKKLKKKVINRWPDMLSEAYIQRETCIHESIVKQILLNQ